MRKTTDNLERFSATASFGELHIDEIRGLFCISRTLTSSGKPNWGNNVFSIYDLDEVGLTCSSPREANNAAYVDIKLECSFVDPCFRFSETIKRRCRCKSKRIDRTHFSWEEPPAFLMFQTLFNQMLSGGWEKVNSLLCGKTVYGFELEKARALFMLPEGYSQNDLRTAYSRMKAVYDTGVQPGEINEEMDIINRYYWLLLSHMEQQQAR